MARNFIVILFFLTPLVHGQDIKHIMIDGNVNGEKLDTYLNALEKQHNIDFVYNEGIVNALTVTGVSESVDVDGFLDLLLKPFEMKVFKARDNVFLILKESLRWKHGKIKENYIVIDSGPSRQQVIKGYVRDYASGEPLIGVPVVIKESGAGTLTDVNGYFELVAPRAVNEMIIQYMGFENRSFVVAFSPLGTVEPVDIDLFSKPMELKGVTIFAAGKDKNVQAVIPGVERLGMEEIKKLPTFLGEVDPIRGLTTLPGVSTVSELASGFNVRGGESGQNLILQDGAIIYNPTHLFGFFSAFNPDIVKDVALYKGGGPARFGGRISAILDVNLRNGDADKHTVSGGVGLVSSRLGIEGPIIKNKTSYLLGGRVSYANWLLKATDNMQLKNSSANFYDLTGKIFHRINENNFISISGYRSYDDFSLASDSIMRWGTTNASIRWDHTFDTDFLSTLNFSSSNYFSEVHNQNQIDAFIYRNSVNNLWLKYDLVYKRSKNINVNFGFDVNRTLLEPGRLTPVEAESNILPVDIHDQNVLESAIYLQNDFDFSSKVAVSAGIRYSYFLRYGADVVYKFDFNNYIGRYPAISDTTNYSGGEIIETFHGLEPRISVRYLMDDYNSLKASYYRTHQYLHLISNTTTVTPQNYWVASGPYLKPQIGDQFSLGYFRNLRNDAFEFSLEGFYKETKNAVDYIEGADITLNKALEAGLVSGEGLSYGVEVLARKNTGVFTGWISYTYSRSLRRFKGEKESWAINNGEYYPSFYDQPHNLSVILNYRLGPRSLLSTNFSYSTGRPITIPISKFSYDAYLSVLNYSERNEYRIPDYHRLDISLTIESLHGKSSRFKGEWVFSIFNVYSRNNAYSIFFNKYGSAKKLSVLGSMFPSVSYNFKF